MIRPGSTSIFRADVRTISRSALGTTWALVVLILVLASQTGFAATDAPPKLAQAQRAAEQAEAAAAEARAAYERALRESQPTAETAPGEGSATTRAIEDAERAANEALEAAREAREAAREARAAVQAQRASHARKGVVVGGGWTYLYEDFDTSFEVDSSGAIYALVGYRAHRFVGVELRGEWIRGFEVRANAPRHGRFDAELDGYVVTLGGKFYPLDGPAQPFLGFGLGVWHAEVDGVDVNGAAYDADDTDVVARVAGGIDVYLSEHLVLNLEAAYLSPGGDLEGLDYGSLAAGLSVRF